MITISSEAPLSKVIVALDCNNENDALLDPDEIAKTYLNFYKQNKSAWSWEIEIRPWVEKF